MDASLTLALTGRWSLRDVSVPNPGTACPLPLVQIGHCIVYAEAAFSTALTLIANVNVKLSMLVVSAVLE
jgi:hypothetical protein